MSTNAIAEELGRNQSTVWRKNKGFAGGRGYPHRVKPHGNGSIQGGFFWTGMMTKKLWSMVKEKLRLDLSPAKVSVRPRLVDYGMVSPHGIYRYVRADRKRFGTHCMCLIRCCESVGRGCILDRRDVSERLIEV